ncbi:unnamed protein product [Adineta steineri]|uniref:ChrR-like cupin domain-containing protein n=1 Tax=Adineta steineri TaxID=433720 RepID=A0A814FFT1_9BILA|nr:unnamed protein product [Adineta steineri]CAF3932487.1 unnamed protein product [Adineta steineri]
MNMNFLLANGPTYMAANSSIFIPYGNPKYDLKMKLIQVDPHTGLWVNILKGSPGSVLGTHRHYDQVYGYTLKGAWGYREHPEWLSRAGDTIHETPGSVHTLYIDDHHGETETLFFVWGALEFLDEAGNTIAIEDWRSILQKYVDYCQKNQLPIVDLTYPKEKVEDVHFHQHHKTDL